MPNAARPLDDGTRRSTNIAKGSDSSPYAATASSVALEMRNLLALLILEMKIGLSLQIANHARPIFS